MTFMVYTLGCKVNMYESNMIREQFLKNGYDWNEEKPNIIVINTCTVTNVADHKSVKAVHHFHKKFPQAKIVVVGCSSQNNSDLFKQEGVVLILGNAHKNQIVSYLENSKEGEIGNIQKQPFEKMMISHFHHQRAFVKIEDGCSNYCTYCIIPYVRGKVRSKRKEDVIKEVQTLTENGHEEIVLTGIHTGQYGVDIDCSLTDLITDLLKLPKLSLLRLSSIEITEITDQLLELFQNPKMAHHLHIPLQSGCDQILQDMHRKYKVEDYLKKIAKIREICPDIALTTDVIVGFPTETENHFLETIATIKKIRFAKIHVFPFSKRDGTIAATLPNLVSLEEKKKRVQKLLQLNHYLESAYQRLFIGKELAFLPETYKKGYLYGHTSNYLFLKVKSSKMISKRVMVKLEKQHYPYVESSMIEKAKLNT